MRKLTALIVGTIMAVSGPAMAREQGNDYTIASAILNINAGLASAADLTNMDITLSRDGVIPDLDAYDAVLDFSGSVITVTPSFKPLTSGSLFYVRFAKNVKFLGGRFVYEAGHQVLRHMTTRRAVELRISELTTTAAPSMFHFGDGPEPTQRLFLDGIAADSIGREGDAMVWLNNVRGVRIDNSTFNSAHGPEAFGQLLRVAPSSDAEGWFVDDVKITSTGFQAGKEHPVNYALMFNASDNKIVNFWCTDCHFDHSSRGSIGFYAGPKGKSQTGGAGEILGIWLMNTRASAHISQGKEWIGRSIVARNLSQGRWGAINIINPMFRTRRSCGYGPYQSFEIASDLQHTINISNALCL